MEFLETILGEVKQEEFLLFEPGGRVWKLAEASLELLKKSFQRTKRDVSNSPFVEYPKDFFCLSYMVKNRDTSPGNPCFHIANPSRSGYTSPTCFLDINWVRHFSFFQCLKWFLPFSGVVGL